MEGNLNALQYWYPLECLKKSHQIIATWITILLGLKDS